MQVNLDDVQAHVLRSLDPSFAIYAFFRIKDRAAFKAFLSSAVQPLVNQRQRNGEIEPRIYSEQGWACSSRQVQLRFHTQVGFTLRGLRAIGLDRRTLTTFPEAFCEGMAARAKILDDTGAAAPEVWHGYLGSDQVHGLLSWIFPRDNETVEADAFSSGSKSPDSEIDYIGRKIRDLIDANGAQVLHVEIGQANFRRFQRGEMGCVEHFGFREGISQPWVDVGSGPPPHGGGTPKKDGTWAPLALGEFLLGYTDEDGLVQPWPSNKALRQSGTYMVFRKLEQDVTGYRRFVQGAAGDERGRRRFAARMIGRWQDGTPLVHCPNEPSESVSEHRSRTINDFRFGRDDPLGLCCPISAHIRRVNPRDSGDRDEVRRHRLLRRSIPYGGRLLPENSSGDGKTRGLLFIAFNARIDQQFEFVQSRWINSGEFVGQVGAGHDPILGTRDGNIGHAFAFASRPVNIGRFATMRGGDYFFVPGMEALSQIANGATFPPDGILPEDALGRFSTPPVLDFNELVELARSQLTSPDAPSFVAKTVSYQAFPGSPVEQKTIAYVAHHKYVTQILNDDLAFGVAPYAFRIDRLLEGRQLLIGLPSSNAVRIERRRILYRALEMLQAHYFRLNPVRYPTLGAVVAEFTKSNIDKVLIQANIHGKLDVVVDLGRVVPVMLIEQLFGIPGPDWVSPTATAARLAQANIANVPPSWLSILPEISDEEKPLVSMQAWSRLGFFQIFGNFGNAEEFAKLAEGAAAELLQHIHKLIERARRQQRSSATLLGCLVTLGDDAQVADTKQQTYDEHMQLILAEMVGASVETINLALANIIDFAVDRPEIIRALRSASSSNNPHQFDAIVREVLRFASASPLITRIANQDTMLGNNLMPKGTLIYLLAQAAMFDPRVFANPPAFDPTRCPEHYLHFGEAKATAAATPAPHSCVGKDIAVAELRELVKAVVMRKNLRRAAGLKGKKREGLQLTSSLIVRFDPLS
jgi:Dyp-type peroxidase family